MPSVWHAGDEADHSRAIEARDAVCAYAIHAGRIAQEGVLGQIAGDQVMGLFVPGLSGPDYPRKAVAAAAALVATKVAAAIPVIEVYKSPTCGCCGKWVEHLRANGFAVNVNDIPDVDAFRVKAGVPAALAACHTALVGGYVVEGHVPAGDIRKLLAERPKALGLAVPGMPAAAPGMDAPHASGYDVLLFQSNGVRQVYHAYPKT